MALIDLKTATPAEIAEALIALDTERPGLSYDVGMALYERDVSKEFPGPSSWDQNLKSLSSGLVSAVAYDPARREDAIAGYRILCDNPIPSYDENDPKWLKATKAERRAAKRAVEEWAEYPHRDRAPGFIRNLERAMTETEYTFKVACTTYNNGPQSRAEAEVLQARWAEYGIVIVIDGFEEPDKTHRRSLRGLSAGPTA